MDWMRPDNVPAFLLVLARTSGMLLTAPVLGSQAIPVPARAGFAAVLALLFTPLVAGSAALPESMTGLAVAAAGELGVGLLLGFAAALLFGAVQAAGHLVDLDMGVALANILDPVTHEQVSLVAQFKLLLATTAWLLVAGHHFLLSATFDSFRAVPVGGFAGASGLTPGLVGTMASGLLVSAVQLAAPALLALMLVTVAMAFLARAVPELNLLFLGYPVRIFAGLVVLALAVGLTLQVFARQTLATESAVRGLLQILGGRP